jgi:hypothetical protein
VALFLHRAVRLIILRVADLVAALLAERRVLARRGWAGEMLPFLNILLGFFNIFPSAMSAKPTDPSRQ